jgi:transcriptional pleiotropic regulator of transition state genes
MTATRMDRLGRIVLPSELRRLMRLQVRDELEIIVEGERIILQKRQDVCVFCLGDNPEVEFKDRWICKACGSELMSRTR